MNQVMSQATLMNFPGFTKNFELCTNVSDYQMGGAVSQEGKTIVFFSRKFNSTQVEYTTTEQELLGVIETL